MLLLLIRFLYRFVFLCLINNVLLKVLQSKTKTDEVKCGLTLLLGTEHSCCVTMVMILTWAKRLSLSTPWMLVLPHNDTQGLRQSTNCLATTFLLGPIATRGLCGRILAGNQQTSEFTRNLPTGSIQSVSFICSSDRPSYHDCTPRDCSERLPFWWTSSFF